MTIEFLISELSKKNNDISKLLKGLDPSIIKNDPQITKTIIQMLSDSLKNWQTFNEYLIEMLLEQKNQNNPISVQQKSFDDN